MTAAHDRLRYLHLSHDIFEWDAKELQSDLFAHESMTLERVSSDQMLALIHHTPNFIIVNPLFFYQIADVDMINIILPKLTHFHLYITSNWLFDDSCRLASVCHYLRRLNLTFND
jgi:hypothetical protein